jgi:hypothetical protein
MNDAAAVADACWAGRLPVRDFPSECKRAAWNLVTDKIWRAARDIMKNEKVFRLRAMRENYHEEFHELIKAEMMMLHKMGWQWQRDENNRKHWILVGSDPACSPPPPGPDASPS